MCNLYNFTTNQAAIITLVRAINRYVGNVPPMPGVLREFPRDQSVGTSRSPHCTARTLISLKFRIAGSLLRTIVARLRS